MRGRAFRSRVHGATSPRAFPVGTLYGSEGFPLSLNPAARAGAPNHPPALFLGVL